MAYFHVPGIQKEEPDVLYFIFYFFCIGRRIDCSANLLSEYQSRVPHRCFSNLNSILRHFRGLLFHSGPEQPEKALELFFEGNNEKKFIPIFAVIFCLSLTSLASAETSNTEAERGQEIAPVTEDQPSSGVIKKGIARETKKKVLKTTYYKDKFIGYNSETPNWSYANKYTISTSTGYSFSAGFSIDGYECKLTTKYKTSVAIHLPANPKKRSRLAAKADVKVQKIKYYQYIDGMLAGTWTKAKATRTSAVTNYVKYKK